MAQQLFEQWFRIADTDKDGAVAGPEAVSFFTRSGLPKSILGQIWELASGGGPKLNQIQFASAMRLVALAQARGGELPLDQARAVIAGVGPSLPPPTLQGLDGPGTATPGAAPAPAPAVGGSIAPYVAAAPGPAATLPYGAAAAVPRPYAAQLKGGAPAAAPTPYAAQPTNSSATPAYGAGHVQPVGAPGGAAAPGAYPPLPASQLQQFQASFLQLDTDRDGFVTGAECFAFFSQSGLEKSVLRDIWNLVAGTEGRLSGAQFVAFLYLIECIKRGLPLPTYLPPGLAGFPPVAAPSVPAPVPASVSAPVLAATGAAVTPPLPAAPAPPKWTLESQFGTRHNITAVLATPQVTSLPPPPPPPTIPPKVDLSSAERLAAPVQHVSQVPAVAPSLLASASAMERTKLQEEQQICEAKEKALHTAEDRVAEARARQAQLTTALQELVMFRKRTEVALLTSQDQARRLEEEVDATRKRYDVGYAAAQSASEKSAALHAHIMELMGQKNELVEKMRRLEGEVAAAEKMGPNDVIRLEGEIAELNSKCAAVEAARNAKNAKVDGLRRQLEASKLKLAELKDAELDAAAEMEGCQVALTSLEAELKEARTAGSFAALPSLISRSATVYRGLLGLAHRVGTAVPFDALPATLEGLHVWAEEVAAGVIDWPDDDVSARGFVIVNALPGADAPRPILKPAPPTKPPAVAHAPQLPVSAAAAAPILSEGFVNVAAAPNGSIDFDDPPAFGDTQAFRSSATARSSVTLPPPPLPTASAGARAVSASSPIEGFGFNDAPAFGAPALPPVASTLPFPSDSLALRVGSDASVHKTGSGDLNTSNSNQFGTVGFGFGGEGQKSLDAASNAMLQGPPAAAITADVVPTTTAVGFDDNAFAVAVQPAPAIFSEAATAVAAPAAVGHIPSLEKTPSVFGDDAFAVPQGFGAGAFAVAPSTVAAAAAAVAPPPSVDSRSNSTGGTAPAALEAADSVAMENPFAWGAPVAFAAAVADATAGSISEPSPAPPAAATASSSASGFRSGVAFSDSFGGNAFGSEPSAAFPPPAAAAQSLPLMQPHAAPPPAVIPPLAAPSSGPTGFEEDNPFGDKDDPFGAPAFR
ncbi:hypothetical protein Vretimale_17992 [Volvox reticuliferus]|uniref:Epidermal growth factor receptor substrate 15 n=1 Tax=Volvox reticuliferus TaxID=1737510 RepID=A0A8J4CVU6_9CHLO|nr:hypothetical protein Vretifemale_17618 [Volvox reticuliferus]GIM15186.1 hypothetical protein Vretimale_17992 [Volvox reticuliferus]